MKIRIVATVTVLLMSVGLVFGQRGRFDDFRSAFGSRADVSTASNIPYDGKFAFVRLTYDTLPGGYWYRGQPAWSHGYPT
jgi:hypothetical protein